MQCWVKGIFFEGKISVLFRESMEGRKAINQFVCKERYFSSVIDRCSDIHVFEGLQNLRNSFHGGEKLR